MYTLDVASKIGHVTIAGVIDQADEVWRASGLDDGGHEVMESVSFRGICMCNGRATYTFSNRLDYIGPVLCSDYRINGCHRGVWFVHPMTSL